MATEKQYHAILSFSSKCDYLAYSDQNGVLKIWDTMNGFLRQEYSPSSHLSLTCTSLAWAPKCELPSISFDFNARSEKGLKKKCKLNTSNELENLELIAMGTTAGTILLYSLKMADLYSSLSNGHKEKVTGLSWSKDGIELFSCSFDRSIIQWDLQNSKIKNKWENTDGPLHSITICQDQMHLLTAGRNIQLWDIEEKKLLQTYSGHSSEVFKLLEIPNLKNSDKEKSDGTVVKENGLKYPDNSYLLSMATGEHKISIRLLSHSKKKVNNELIGSFVMHDEPVHIDIQPIYSKQSVFQLLVVTRLGHLAFFEYGVNGSLTKTQRPLKLSKFCTKSTLATPDHQLNNINIHKINETKNNDINNRYNGRMLGLVAACFLKGQNNICVVYEDFLRPVFDRLHTDDLKGEMVRKDPRKTKISIVESSSKVKIPLISKNVSLVTETDELNSFFNPLSNHLTDSNKKKRKRTSNHSSINAELSLGERASLLEQTQNLSENNSLKINEINNSKLNSSIRQLTKPGTSSINHINKSKENKLDEFSKGTVGIKTDSLAILLQQGLQSQDKLILNNVLQKVDDNIIKTTVSRVQSIFIIPLIKELSHKLTGHAQSAKNAAKWLRTVIECHSAFLISIPDIDKLLLPLVSYLETPPEIICKLFKLKGKLDAIVLQMLNRINKCENREDDQKAICNIQTTERIEDEFLFEDVQNNLTSEDEWDEDSDMDNQQTNFEESILKRDHNLTSTTFNIQDSDEEESSSTDEDDNVNTRSTFIKKNKICTDGINFKILGNELHER